MKKYTHTGTKETRAGFGAAMLELTKNSKNVMALSADLTSSLKLEEVAEKYPAQFLQMGIAEANMISVAAGLSIAGKIPFVTGFANFITGRVYDQIRQSVAYSNTNVKICASHAGLTLGEDGATHQILEDLGLMRMLPNMVVINTCDYNQTFAATLAIAKYPGPAYLRFGRPKVPNFTHADEEFIIGKGLLLKDGNDLTIVATGHLVWEALMAAEQLHELHQLSARVINIHTIKPLDEEIILLAAAETGALVSAEEHQENGGLGDAIAQLLTKNLPTVQEFIAVKDSFGESGKPAELMTKYELNASAIVKGCLRAHERKTSASFIN